MATFALQGKLSQYFFLHIGTDIAEAAPQYWKQLSFHQGCLSFACGRVSKLPLVKHQQGQKSYNDWSCLRRHAFKETLRKKKRPESHTSSMKHASLEHPKPVYACSKGADLHHMCVCAQFQFFANLHRNKGTLCV
eukprot:590929-Amphidinium_carterae.1